MALGAVIVLVVWIGAGGRPFGRIISSSDVSEPTTAAAPRPTVEQRAVIPASAAVRLGSRPPELARAPELRFARPKEAKAKPAKTTRRARTVKPKRVRPKRTHRTPVVRVVAPPEQADQVGDAPVAALPEPAPTEPPQPAAPAPVSGAGGGSPKPSPPDPVYWVGEG
jgi:hypothetical protein